MATDNTEDTIISLRDIVLKRGQNVVLTDVDWTVRPKEHWALLGPNGAGKTLLLRIVTGYIWPTCGQVTVLGRRLGTVDLRHLRKKIGWVSQALADLMPGHVSLHEVIASGPLASLGIYVEPDQELFDRAAALAEDFGLAQMLERPFHLLSSGERQRTMLARATLAQPSLLILDEPMSNLDMGGRELFLKLVSRLAQGPNAPTIILTTHNINEIGPFITNTIILKKGRVLSEGPISESLTAANLQQAFDLPLKLEKTKQGRYMAWLD